MNSLSGTRSRGEIEARRFFRHLIPGNILIGEVDIRRKARERESGPLIGKASPHGRGAASYWVMGASRISSIVRKHGGGGIHRMIHKMTLYISAGDYRPGCGVRPHGRGRSAHRLPG